MNRQSIEAILTNGFEIWKKNKIIGLAFVLNAFSLFFLGIIFILLSLSFLGNTLISFYEGVYSQDFSYISLIQEVIFILLFLLLLFLFFALIVNSFFLAGAVGMTKEAMQKGKTKLGDMLFYGKKKFLSLFFAAILILFFQLLGLIFLIPGLISFFVLNSVGVGLLLLVLGILLFVLYLLILRLLLVLMPQAIVIDDLGPFDGVKKAYLVFMNNKLSVLILLVAISVIFEILNMFLRDVLLFPLFLLMSKGYIGTILSIIFFAFVILFILFVLQPIITLWLTALYLNRTGKEIAIDIADESTKSSRDFVVRI
ncbi:MAG: hypothetical protein QW802_02655 [Candidatus Altiarchaeota archaeon]